MQIQRSFSCKETSGKSKKRVQRIIPQKEKLFDPESLTNPYTDTRVLFGDLKRRLKQLWRELMPRRLKF